jgi:PAS domain S-box-containing protein
MDGTQVTILAHKFLEENVGARTPGVLETVTDVTQLRRIEADRRTAEARESLFIENAPAAIAVFDNAMCYIAVSRRFMLDYRLDGRTREDLVGRSHYDLFPEIPDPWRAIHRRVLAGETVSSEAEAFERADGRIDWVRWEMVPWRHAGGAIRGAILFSEDMTGRRAAAAALRDKDARLRLVQKVGGIAWSDRLLTEDSATISGEFTQLFGLPPEQTRITPAALLSLVHPDDQQRIGAMTPITLAQDGRRAAEFRIQRSAGDVRWISMQTEVFHGSDGQPCRIIAALHDITELMAARQILAARHDELERSNADLEEFAYAVLARSDVAASRDRTPGAVDRRGCDQDGDPGNNREPRAAAGARDQDADTVGRTAGIFPYRTNREDHRKCCRRRCDQQHRRDAGAASRRHYYLRPPDINTA